MKKKAFLHALVIVILFSVSWVLLFMRLDHADNGKVSPPEDQAPARKSVPRAEPDPAGPDREPAATGTARPDRPTVPDAWSEWIAYLEQQDSPAKMRNALEAMRQTLFSMDPEEALYRLQELIDSGVDLPTGLRFQVGPNHGLAGAPDLQTMLLDWLWQMDPVLAASRAKATLARHGQSLGPDAYVIQLRNYALGTTDPVGDRDRLVGHYFDRLVSNRDWTRQPPHSIAEAMDFAVFLGDGSLVPALAQFMADSQSPALGHAGSMAIERLVDLDPVGSVTAILGDMGRPGMSAHARAGFVARLDPADPRAFQLQTEYLQHPSVSRQEAATFLSFLPNLNKTFSHNLVSPQFSITELGDHMDRLAGALDAVNDWQSPPVRNDLQQELTRTTDRLLSQIRGEPAP